MEQGRTGDRVAFRRDRQEVAEPGPAFLLNIILVVGVSLSLAIPPIRARSPDDASFERFRVITEKNIFGRHRAADPTAQAQSEAVPETHLADIKLVGIVRMRDPFSSIAIIEEGGKHRLCRVGDRLGVLTLRSIRDQDIVFETPAGSWRAEIEPGTMVHRDLAPLDGPNAPGFVTAPQEPGPAVQNRLPVRAVDIRQLPRAGLVTYSENGVVMGLRLTRDTLGLKEGDRVTHVDGQALCTRRPKQKLWQIVRKHSASREHIAAIHVVVERNNRTLEFLVAPVG